jgi:hypothetical protein
LAHLIYEKCSKNLRSLDLVAKHQAKDCSVISLLFPLAGESSAQGFLARLFTLVDIKEDDPRMKFSLFSLADIELIEEFSETGKISRVKIRGLN